MEIWFDGACRGNPGPSGAGVLLRYEGGEERLQRALGRKTNNEAEYEALILGLETALERGATSVRVFGDSKLVIEQAAGRWRVRAGNLRGYSMQVHVLAAGFEQIEFCWVPRARNARADALAASAFGSREGRPRIRIKREPVA